MPSRTAKLELVVLFDRELRAAAKASRAFIDEFQKKNPDPEKRAELMRTLVDTVHAALYDLEGASDEKQLIVISTKDLIFKGGRRVGSKEKS